MNKFFIALLITIGLQSCSDSSVPKQDVNDLTKKELESILNERTDIPEDSLLIYLKAASAKGSTESKNKLAEMYFYGIKTEKDIDAAFRYMDIYSDPKLKADYGFELYQNAQSESEYEKAHNYLERFAFDKGPLESRQKVFYALAIMSYMGQGTLKNHLFAYEFFELAEKVNYGSNLNSVILFHLGTMSMNGEGCTESIETAQKYFIKGRHYPSSNYMLAMLKLNGQLDSYDKMEEVAYYTERAVNSKSTQTAGFTNLEKEYIQKAKDLWNAEELWKYSADAAEVSRHQSIWNLTKGGNPYEELGIDLNSSNLGELHFSSNKLLCSSYTTVEMTIFNDLHS